MKKSLSLLMSLCGSCLFAGVMTDLGTIGTDPYRKTKTRHLRPCTTGPGSQSLLHRAKIEKRPLPKFIFG